jgi:Family of unknown function (DUF5681)
MTTTHDELMPGNRPAKNRPKDDYEVGYCRPPAEHRFKHGNKANPKGRKKGSRNREVVIREVLLGPVTVREGDTVRQMPALEAVLKKMLAKALAGDNKAALTIIGIAQKEGVLTPEQEQVVDDLSESDQAILEDVRRRLEASTLAEAPAAGAEVDASPEASDANEPVAP